MADREVDGFQIWAEANKVGDEPAFAYVMTKSLTNQTQTKRFHVITTQTFTSLDAAQAAARDVVQRITSVADNGVPIPLDY